MHMPGLKRTTLRGLTVGSVPVKGGDYRRPCVLFGREFTSWLPALQELGLRCVWICCTVEPSCFSLLQALVGDDCPITTWTDRMDGIPRLHSQPTLGFVDGRVAGHAYAVCNTLGIHTLLSTKGIRRAPPEWKFQNRITLMHSEVGGVTDAQLCITAIASRPFTISNDPQAPCYAPRDASTVLGLKPSCFSFRPAPAVATINPLRVLQLGVQGHQPFFHGGGLLSYPLTKRTLVLTPTLFAPKHHWGLRCLGTQEALECLDWPVGV